MTTTRDIRRPRSGAWRMRRKPRAPGIPYTMTLADGRTVFVEVPGHMAAKDRAGELAFTPEGVRLLDRVRALSRQADPAPSPAFLAALRESLGLTQAQLARLVGRDRLTVSRWECGTVRPSAEALGRFYALAHKRKAGGVVLAG